MLTHEAGHETVGGRLVQAVDRVDLLDHALVHDDDARGQGAHRRAGNLGQLQQQADRLSAVDVRKVEC